jgi:hypothetical protein
MGGLTTQTRQNSALNWPTTGQISGIDGIPELKKTPKVGRGSEKHGKSIQSFEKTIKRSEPILEYPLAI